MMILNLKFALPSLPPMSLSRTVLAVLPGKSADERILALRVEHGTVAVVPACEALSEEASDGEILSFEAFRRSRPQAAPEPAFELCYQSWAERIGWFTQHRVPITGEQAAALRNVFGAFAETAKRPPRRSVVESFAERSDRETVHVGSA
jgi:hypothetical protein